MSNSQTTAQAIVALINSSPRTPSVAQIACLIDQTVAAPLPPAVSEIRRVRLERKAAEAVAIAEEEAAARDPAWRAARAPGEMTPAEEAARAHESALDAEFDAIAAAAWAKRERLEEDLAARIEITLGWSLDVDDAGEIYAVDGRLLGPDFPIEDAHPSERAYTELLSAAVRWLRARHPEAAIS